jgi:hypothetical protein
LYNPRDILAEGIMALPRRRSLQPDQDRQASAPGLEPDWRALYEIENPAEVDAYVAEHPVVVSILAHAPSKVAAAFEEEPRLVLRHEIDPDDEPASEYLVVDIVTMRDVDDAHDRLNRFDDGWWLDDALPRAARAGATIVFYPRFT